MPAAHWSKRFFDSTRGRIIRMLAGATRTVSDLARHLGMTENAVRAQLSTLERDGLARQSGIQPAFRKPNYTYDLTEEGHQLFPKLYAPVLEQLLEVLTTQLGKRKAGAMLRDAGLRLAERHLHAIRALPADQRLPKLIELLTDLGFPIQVEVEGDQLLVRGCSCPLASVVRSHPELCQSLAGLLSEVVGQPVTEQCDRGQTPRCCFRTEDKSG